MNLRCTCVLVTCAVSVDNYPYDHFLGRQNGAVSSFLMDSHGIIRLYGDLLST